MVSTRHNVSPVEDKKLRRDRYRFHYKFYEQVYCFFFSLSSRSDPELMYLSFTFSPVFTRVSSRLSSFLLLSKNMQIGLATREHVYELVSNPGSALSPCAQCSRDGLLSHCDPIQDKAVTEEQ